MLEYFIASGQVSVNIWIKTEVYVQCVLQILYWVMAVNTETYCRCASYYLELTAESSLDAVSPGDNPTYGLPYTAAALALPMSSLHTAAANGTSGNSVERDFDNPLYTSRELPNHEYTSPGHVYATLEPGKGSYDYLESAELGHQHHPQATSTNLNNGLYEHNSDLDYEDIR